MSDRHLSVIFCDDVRQEVSGKLTLVGCYGAEMLALQFPIQLPRLCVSFSAETYMAKPFQYVSFVVSNDSGHEYARVELTPSQLHELLLNTPNDEDASNAKYSVNAVLQISPLIVESPTKLRVFALTESGEIQGRPLRVRQVTPEELAALQNS